MGVLNPAGPGSTANKRIGALSAALLVAGTALPAQGAEPKLAELSIKVLQEQLLPAPLRHPKDVRWPEEGVAWVAAGKEGTFAVNLNEPEKPPLLLVESPPGSMGLHFHLAWAAPRFWLAAPVRALGWREMRDGQLLPGGYTPGLDTIRDVDAFAGRALVLGASRGKDGSFCPDGAIAWLGTIAGRELALKPVMFSSSGPGAQNLDYCGVFDGSKARFLADGSFLIVPGVQPGVFWYDPEGKLKRSWTSEELGIAGGCGLSTADAYRYSEDEAARYRERINQRVNVDEILVLPQGPALVTRRWQEGAVRWGLLRLAASGEVKSESLPISSPAERAHLRGDTRGSKALLLVSAYDPDGKAPPPKLLILELSP